MMDSVKKQFDNATTSKTKAERQAAAVAFAAEATKAGLPKVFHELKLTDLLNTNLKLEGKKAGPNREGALYCVSELCKANKASGIFLIPCISEIFNLQGDKLKPVAGAAVEAAEAIFMGIDDNLVELLLPALCTKVLANAGNADRFKQIQELCISAPTQVACNLADLIPACVPFMKDINKVVAKAAEKCLKALCDTCTNPDMEPFIPSLVKCMKDVSAVPETVFAIASTTFVAEVDSSALSIMAPVLKMGLVTKSATAVKRQSSRIIENMAKLVDEPRHLSSFLPQILPLLESGMVHVSDPEARDILGKATAILTRKSTEAKPLKFDMVVAAETVKELTTKITASLAPEFAGALTIAAYQMKSLNEVSEYDAEKWFASVVPTLVNCAGFAEAKAKEVVESARVIAEASREEIVEEEIDEGAEVLCDLPFGLAYGNKVLLRKTKLKLLRGHKYGLLGQNDSGKTSLLQALADYKIDGFPSAEECRTIFVATDIKTELADLRVIDYMMNDPLLKDCGVSEDKMISILNSFGFQEGKAANTTQPVGTLSGGWRMKLALSRAMLLKADILLLDEPTNHLDAYNVKWVEAYLNSLKDVTCIMVSHDSGLLTRVCNKIIEIDNMKLNYFMGNLAAFVEMKPEAKCYFELSEKGKIDFNFPNPGALPGITSKGKAILKMSKITFTYPNPDGSYTGKKPQLNNVSIQVSLSSRVACVGENGAGKSTMIKLLTGELEPDKGSGDVWKHPNCRVGYIAQHAFHHIEKHLDETANDYIRWRYANGGDREETVKVTSICTADEIKKQQANHEFTFKSEEDGSSSKRKLSVDRFTERRRENKKDRCTEYECVFTGVSGNLWMDKDQLIKAGWEKVLKILDERIAMRATTFARPLTKENVQKHLADVGLEPEFSTHMRIGSLSGGQKVKVVLASALWNQPHILILDEPTNYLDRESLGALARAIRAFEGGVVMITHNSQFCDNLCPVVWHLQNNTLDIKGDAEWMAESNRAKIVVQEIDEADMVDKFGNTVTIKKAKSKKEMKLKKQRRAKRFKATGDDYDSSEEDC